MSDAPDIGSAEDSDVSLDSGRTTGPTSSGWCGTVYALSTVHALSTVYADCTAYAAYTVYAPGHADTVGPTSRTVGPASGNCGKSLHDHRGTATD